MAERASTAQKESFWSFRSVAARYCTESEPSRTPTSSLTRASCVLGRKSLACSIIAIRRLRSRSDNQASRPRPTPDPILKLSSCCPCRRLYSTLHLPRKSTRHTAPVSSKLTWPPHLVHTIPAYDIARGTPASNPRHRSPLSSYILLTPASLAPPHARTLTGDSDRLPVYFAPFHPTVATYSANYQRAAPFDSLAPLLLIATSTRVVAVTWPP